MDIIDRIDQVLGCAQCGGELDDSPSINFCGENCQDQWRAAQADPMAALAGPDHLPGSLGATVADMEAEIAQMWEEMFRRNRGADPAVQRFCASLAAHSDIDPEDIQQILLTLEGPPPEDSRV